jgi:RNA polymerase sigma-70 factor, ECF subfamily
MAGNTAAHVLELMQRVQRGDRAAAEKLYAATSRFLFGYIRQILLNAEDAEDALVDTYLTIWRTAGAFNPKHGGALRWMILIARSRAIDALRRRRRQENVLEYSREASAIDGAASAEGGLLRRERGVQLRRAMDSLPETQLEVLRMAFFGEMTHLEIAAQKGIPLGTVKARIRGGLARLRNLMENGSGRR